MEFSESVVPLTMEYSCLLCREKLKYFGDPSCPSSSLNPAENAEVLQDVFQVFSKYMGWDPPPKYKYNFHKDQFPFCRVCNLILIRIYKINEDIQSLEKQIEQFLLAATAKIVESECKIPTGTEDYNQRPSCPDFKETAKSCDTARLDERKICFYYREYILKRYSVRVQLTSEDMKQLENYKLAVESKLDAAGNLEQDYFYDGFTPSPETPPVSEEDRHPDAQEIKTNGNEKKGINTSQGSTCASDKINYVGSENPNKKSEPKILRARKQSFNSRIKDFDRDDADDGILPSPGSSVHSEYDPATVVKETITAKRNRIRTAQHSKRASDSSDEKSSGDSDNEGEGPEIPRARKQPFRYQTKQLSPNEYLLDDKLHFVYENPGWKCSSCSTTALQRTTIISHMLSSLCSGFVSPKSVKELQHRGFKYDKLDDGRFECRRCPFAAALNSSLKRHIVGSHCRACKRDLTKLNLRQKLVRSARVIQPRPDVFLVNNQHEFRLLDSNFSCSTCSFRTPLRDLAIRHVFQKHDSQYSQLKSSRVERLRIDRVGPSKYKRGDFHFEAFPNEYKCTTCGSVCPSLLKMKQHIRYEHAKDISKHVCEICGFSTFYKLNFKQHMNTHKDERPFLCHTCGKSSKTQVALRIHEATVHPTAPVVKPHLCDICGQKFKLESILTDHKKTHQHVDCEICGKTCSVRYLRVHLLSHNAEKMFECKQCGSKFLHKVSLCTHSRSCNGDKPYSCDICGMKFTQAYSVTRHKNVAHNPEKPTRTCIRKGPAKQRRGQSLLTNKKNSSSSRNRRKHTVVDDTAAAAKVVAE